MTRVTNVVTLHNNFHRAGRIVSRRVGRFVIDFCRLSDGETSVSKMTVCRNVDIDGQFVERVVVKDRFRPLDVGDESAFKIFRSVDKKDRRWLAEVNHRWLGIWKRDDQLINFFCALERLLKCQLKSTLGVSRWLRIFSFWTAIMAQFFKKNLYFANILKCNVKEYE